MKAWRQYKFAAVTDELTVGLNRSIYWASQTIYKTTCLEAAESCQAIQNLNRHVPKRKKFHRGDPKFLHTSFFLGAFAEKQGEKKLLGG